MVKLGFGVQVGSLGLGVCALGLGSRFLGLGCRTEDPGSSVCDFGVWRLGILGMGCIVVSLLRAHSGLLKSNLRVSLCSGRQVNDASLFGPDY